LKAFLLFTILTGVVYPLFITGLAQVIFPGKSNGSLMKNGNKTIGSELIGQQFSSGIYFTSRPSAINYNTLPSGGSNYGLTNLKFRDLVYYRQKQFIAANKLDNLTIIPSEMLFASASGLDPHISQEAALLQVDRIAETRNFNTVQKQKLVQMIKSLTEKPQFLVLGKERINILVLNLELDKLDQILTNNK